MKKAELNPRNFRDMTGDEKLSCTGGGFAYDVGRLLRFAFIAGPQGTFAPAAMLDFLVVRTL